MPDNRQEHPQRGIDDADIVFVELEGYLDADGYSATRLVPVFHSTMPDTVEPVRSIRPVDVPLLSPMDAIIGNTGAAKWMINYVKNYRAHLEAMLSYLATRGTGSYGTDQSRVYQYQGQTYYDRATTCHPKVLAKQTKRFRDGPPQRVLPRSPRASKEVSTVEGQEGPHGPGPVQGRRLPHGLHLRQVLGALPAQHAVGPARPGRRQAGLDRQRAGHQGAPALRRSPGGTTSRSTTSSTRRAPSSTSTAGRYVTGTWRKAGVEKPFTFTLKDGTPLKMAPGQTFVELPDTKAKLRIGD